MATTTKPYRRHTQLLWPLTAEQVQELDGEISSLYRTLKNGVGGGTVDLSKLDASNLTSGLVPDAVLQNIGVAAATYGDATHVAQVTVDAKGRVTGATNVAISGTNGTFNETPGGTINSSNTSFTTAASYTSGTLRVYLNGIRLAGADYSETGSTTFSMVTAPVTGDLLRVDYGQPGTAPVVKYKQVVNIETGAMATGTTIIPLDDTIPQITEGTEFITLAVTPTSSTNKLKITVTVFATVTGTPWIIAALFQDATANALAVATSFNGTSTAGMTITFTHYMTAGTTSATTFRVRIGPSAAGTITFNGQSGGRLFGGAFASSITIEELVP